MLKQEFIKLYHSPAQKAGECFGINPVVILAQSAIETGWGESTQQRNITISSVSPPTDVPTPSGKEPIDIAGYSLMAARLIGGLYKLFTA